MTLLLLCGGIAGPAAAQRTAGDDQPVGNTAVRAEGGGFGTFLGDGLGVLVNGLSIEARVQTLYETNIRRLGDGFAVRPGRSRADFRISPSVAVSNVIGVGRQQLYLNGEYGRDFYLRNSDLKDDRYALGAGLNARVGSFCRANLNSRFQRRQNLLSEASISDSNLTEILSFGASATCERPIGLGFGVSAARDAYDNKDVARQVFDSRSTVFGANVSYSTPVLGQLTVGGSYSKIDYPRRDVFVAMGSSVASVRDGVDIYSGNISYRRTLGPRLTVNVGGSYYLAKPDPRDVLTPLPPTPFLVPTQREDFSGAGYQFGLSYRPGSRLTADLRGARDISQSSSVGALFVVRDSFGADFGYRIGPAITTGVGASYDIRRYRNAFASIEEPLPRVRDTISRVYARVSYAPRRLYDVDFEVGHQRRNSKPSFFDFKSTSAALTLRVRFGRG